MGAMLSDDERRALGRCLRTLLLTVAGSDGRSTAPEIAVIARSLRELDERFGPGHHDDDPGLADDAHDAEGLGVHLAGPEIEQARAALARLPADRRAAYEASFVAACLAVAEASADYLGLGARINDDERAALTRVFDRLGLRVTDPAARQRLLG